MRPAAAACSDQRSAACSSPRAGVQDAQVEGGVPHAPRLSGLGEPRLSALLVPGPQQQDRQRVRGLPVPGVGRAPVPLLGRRGAPLFGAEQAEVVGAVHVARVHRGPVPALGGLGLAPLGVQCAQRVRRVPVAVLGGPQPPHGGVLGVARVAQQEPERAGGPHLAVLGGRQVPASGLLELAALLQDRPEVQRGPPVAASGGLPVPLLHLVQHLDTVVTVGLPRRLPVQRPGQAVRRLPVPTLGRDPHPLLGPGVAAVLQQVGEGVRTQGCAPVPAAWRSQYSAAGSSPRSRWCRPRACAAAADPATAAIRHQPAALLAYPRWWSRTPRLLAAARSPAAVAARRWVSSSTVEITTAQQHGPEDTHRLDVAGLRGEPLTQLLGRLVGDLPGLVRGVGVLPAGKAAQNALSRTELPCPP
ncbi:hypothetical protein SVIOM74S_06375 [Streptomyces violarus]